VRALDRSVPDGDDEFAAVRRRLLAVVALRSTALPKYQTLEQPLAIQTSGSNLLTLTWKGSGITADFIIPGECEKALRVHFKKTNIVRILDEFAISTEEDIRASGLVSEHFAYVVEDSLFWKSQSEAFKIVFNKVRHYRFITGWNCLDVISDVEPSMNVVMRSPII
jgi:hypothetical protein